MGKHIFFINSDTGTSTGICDTLDVLKWMFSIVFVIKNEAAHVNFSFLLYSGMSVPCTNSIREIAGNGKKCICRKVMRVSSMRILIKERYSLAIQEVEEVEMDEDKSALYLPKQGIRYCTEDKTEELFRKILLEGYADLSEFERKRCVREVLL
mgnify:CR=1 FL=1